MPDEYLKRDTRGSTLKFVTPAVHAQLFFLVVTVMPASVHFFLAVEVIHSELRTDTRSP